MLLNKLTKPADSSMAFWRFTGSNQCRHQTLGTPLHLQGSCISKQWRGRDAYSNFSMSMGHSAIISKQHYWELGREKKKAWAAIGKGWNESPGQCNTDGDDWTREHGIPASSTPGMSESCTCSWNSLCAPQPTKRLEKQLTNSSCTC